MNATIIRKLIKKNNGIITAREVSEYNIESWYLTNMVKNGELERVSRGVYFSPIYDNYDELYFFRLRIKCAYILIKLRYICMV